MSRQPPLRLMPPIGNSIKKVFLVDALLNLIMEYFLLALILKEIGLSKIVGALLGDKTDISPSKMETVAEFANLEASRICENCDE